MNIITGKKMKLIILSLITFLQILIISSSSYNVIGLQASNLAIIEPIFDETRSLYDIYSNLYTQESIKYNPINNVSGTGSSFTAKDILNVYNDQFLNLTFNSGSGFFEDIFFINPISGYSTYSLNYNITDISAKSEWYPVEDDIDGTQIELDVNQIALAQAFKINWDYAVFKGSKIYLFQDGHTGFNNLELLIVKADEISGHPNMSYVYTSDMNDPYNYSSNQIPLSTIDDIAYYNFTDTVLERGTYFIVANLSNPQTSAKNFYWFGNTLGEDDGDTYFRDSGGAWSLASMDLTCIPLLMPSDEYGSPLQVVDPTEINLQDNNEDVLTLTYSIPSIGSHTLTSNTSVEINFNNSYSFSLIIIITY